MNENYVYPAELIREGEFYRIKFLDFPNMAIAEEHSQEDAVKSAQAYLALEIMNYEKKNKSLPTPSEGKSNTIFIHVWMPRFRSETKDTYVKKNVTIPTWLDILAKENNISYSAAFVKGLKITLGIDE